MLSCEGRQKFCVVCHKSAPLPCQHAHARTALREQRGRVAAINRRRAMTHGALVYLFLTGSVSRRLAMKVTRREDETDAAQNSGSRQRKANDNDCVTAWGQTRYINSTRLNNVNASSRALIWSSTLDGRKPINNLARRGRKTILCHGPQPRAPLATCKCMRPAQLGWWPQSGETIRKTKQRNHCSPRLRKKTWLYQLPTATLSETINHSSIPRTRTSSTTRNTPPYAHSSLIHLTILEMLLPNHVDVKTWRKRHQPRKIRPQYMLKGFFFPLPLVQGFGVMCVGVNVQNLLFCNCFIKRSPKQT